MIYGIIVKFYIAQKTFFTAMILLFPQSRRTYTVSLQHHGEEEADHRHRLRHRRRSGHNDGPGGAQRRGRGCHLCVWERGS